MKTILVLLLVLFSGCALVPEYDTPISEHNVEAKEERLEGK